MLELPIEPLGRWIMNNEGLKIYDGLGLLVENEADKDVALKMSKILFDNESSINEGTQTKFKSVQLKEQLEEQWNYYNSHCTQCEKKLPKQFYSYENKNLCARCYNKEDRFINNRIKLYQ